MYSPNPNAEKIGRTDSISHANSKGRNEGRPAMHNLSGIRPRRYAHTLFINIGYFRIHALTGRK
jgi:hypothetical protein